MDEPLTYNNPILYSYSTANPILKITLDELLTPAPSDFKISTNLCSKPRFQLEPNKEILFQPYTFLMSYQYPDFHRSSHIFNYNITILLNKLIPKNMNKQNESKYINNDLLLDKDPITDDDDIKHEDFQTLFYFPIIPYNPNYIGIKDNLIKLIIASLIPNNDFQNDPFSTFELLQIIKYFFPEMESFFLKYLYL